MIHLDHAATTGYRPPEVAEAMLRALQSAPANPGRGGHILALSAARLLEGARLDLADFLGVTRPAHLAFTKNATEAINIVLYGFLEAGDTVLASPFEHNAVMRPLRDLERRRGLRIEAIPYAPEAGIDLAALRRRLAAGGVRLLALTMASNVSGEIFATAEVAALCREHGVFCLIDGAQGAGVVPLDVDKEGYDALAVTGHKALLGPPGTGALYLREPERVRPLVRGGTGSRSDSEEQPDFPPDCFEAGTQNVPAVAGLGEAVAHLGRVGLESIRAHHQELTGLLRQRLGLIPGVTLHGPADPARRVGVLSFTVAGQETHMVARELDRRGILCRAGLHCAVRAHHALGTFPGGTVRFSVSWSNTAEEMEQAADAVREIATS